MMNATILRSNLVLALLLPSAVARAATAAATIDRAAVVARHNPVIRAVNPAAPLTVGNGGFAFTVDATGLQTFADHHYLNGIPLETLARWCWTTEDNPAGYTLADVNRDYRQPDGSTLALPSRLDLPASDWLRRNPRLHPLGQLALEWNKPDGTPFAPADVSEPEQTLDLWRGVITSRYRLGGVPVTVVTTCDAASDTVAVRIESPLVSNGQLRVRLAFPRGHDPKVKNTPAFVWDRPESHRSELVTSTRIAREVSGTRYIVASDRAFETVAPHVFRLAEASGDVLAFSLRFSAEEKGAVPAFTDVRRRAEAHWADFWAQGAAVDFAGSTHPLATKLENRIVLSRYLTAVQNTGEVPPQESGLTCNTWYGKHHTEMIWWHVAHFALWGRPDLAELNLAWFRERLPAARSLAASRGLRGARWAKMVGPDGRESPGGNPLIVWNQPHPIYLAELLYRAAPTPETQAKWSELVSETAECLASMLIFDKATQRFVLGPPLWIAQEIHDPATSQNPSFELAYWRWALETAQTWRVRSGLARNADWDERLAKLSPLPVADGKYVALESHPDTWTNLDSRHDHPEMLMPLGFLPGGPDVNRSTMERTFDAVLREWDWEAKIWGWDYPMIAMTAARLGRTEEAIEVLLRDGPNNRYLPNGHCPQRSDRVQTAAGEGRFEIAVYLPANGSFLAAVALMLGGWDGTTEPFPGFTKDGRWQIRAEGFQTSL